MIKFHNINGVVTPVSEAMIYVNDLGLLRGYGIFDFFPLRRGLPVFMTDYFNRFYRSASLMGLEVPIEREALRERVIGLVRKNEMQRGYMKLVLTGGYAQDGYKPGKNNLFILQHEDIAYPLTMYQNGVRLLLQRYEREHPIIKTLNYANVLQQRERLDKHGALDLLYHDGRYINETSRANFFAIDQNEIIHTCFDTVLQGITRKHVIQCALQHGFAVQEQPIALELLPKMREAFITSTTKGVLPVVKLNDLLIGGGAVGSLTVRLSRLFKDYVDDFVSTEQPLFQPFGN